MTIILNGTAGITFPDGTTQADGLSTPVPVADGGTGLSSPGSNGNVLTSNGTAWVSSALPPSGYSGSTTSSSAVDITLTSSSTQVQYVAMTAADKFVILPDATTLTKGAGVFTIINQGQYTFGVKDGAGNVIYGTLNGFDSVTFTLIANSAAAGTWMIVVNNEIVSLLSSSVSISTAAYGIDSFCLLSSTSFLVSYRTVVSTTVSYYVIAGTISGTTATFGTPTLVQSLTMDSTFPQNYAGYLAKTSSTTAVLSATYIASGPTETVRAWSISVSGTTATAGTGNSFLTSGGTAGFVRNSSLSLGGTAAVIFAINTNSNSFTARIATSSGTTLTIGSANTLPTSPVFSEGRNATIAADKFYWVDENGGLYIFSVSGTTITRGTLFAAPSNITSGSRSKTIVLSSTQFLANQTLVTYSGTTVSSAVLQSSNAAPVAGEESRIGDSVYTATQKQNLSGSVVFSAGTVGSTSASSITQMEVIDSTTLVGGCTSSTGYVSVIIAKVL